MPSTPITRCFAATWSRPSIELLDRRGAVVSALANVSDIAGFVPGDDLLSVRFVNGYSVDVTLTQLAVIIPTTSADTAARPFVESVASTLDAHLAAIRITLQHLVDWPEEVKAEDVQAAVAQDASGIPGATASAGLFDARHDDDLTLKAEYGIVSAREVPDRLARLVGRRLGPQIQLTADPGLFAATSTFVDSHWTFRTLADVRSAETWVLVSQVDQYAAELAQALHTRLRASGGEKTT